MKVKDLMVMLAELPPDLTVLVSSDAEGNNFHLLSENVSIGYAEKAGYGYEYHQEEHYDDPNGYHYPGDNAVVLWSC